MLSEKEFEAVKEIEQLLTSPVGLSPEIGLIQEPYLVLLSQKPLAPVEGPQRQTYELFVANAGAIAVRLTRICADSEEIDIRCIELPAILPSHSAPRRIRFSISPAAFEERGMLSLSLEAEPDVSLQFEVQAAHIAEKVDFPQIWPYQAREFFSIALPFRDESIEIYPGVLNFGEIPYWGDVRLEADAVHADTVTLVGGFPGQKEIRLQRQKSGKWAASVALPDGEYYYCIEQDGARVLNHTSPQHIRLSDNGIEAKLSVNNFRRWLRVRNQSRKTVSLSMQEVPAWLDVKPESSKVSPGGEASFCLTLDKSKMEVGIFDQAIKLRAGKTNVDLRIRGNLNLKTGAALIEGNFKENTIQAGKCIVGKPLSIPLKIKSIGQRNIRFHAFDTLSGEIQNKAITIEEPGREQIVDLELKIATDFLMPHQKRFRLFVQTNCRFQNIGGDSFFVECQPVFLDAKPRVLDFSFVRPDSEHLILLSAARSDGEPVDLAWQLSKNLTTSVHIVKEATDRLRIQATGTELLPNENIDGDLEIVDVKSGANISVPCILELVTKPKRRKRGKRIPTP